MGDSLQQKQTPSALASLASAPVIPARSATPAASAGGFDAQTSALAPDQQPGYDAQASALAPEKGHGHGHEHGPDAAPDVLPPNAEASKKGSPLSAAKAQQVLNDAFKDYKAIDAGNVKVLDQAAFQEAYDAVYGETKWSWEKWVKPVVESGVLPIMPRCPRWPR